MKGFLWQSISAFCLLVALISSPRAQELVVDSGAEGNPTSSNSPSLSVTLWFSAPEAASPHASVSDILRIRRAQAAVHRLSAETNLALLPAPPLPNQLSPFAPRQGYVPPGSFSASPRVPLLGPKGQDGSINRQLEASIRPRMASMMGRNLITDVEAGSLIHALRNATVHISKDGPADGNFARYTTGEGHGDDPEGVYLYTHDLDRALRGKSQTFEYLVFHELKHFGDRASFPWVEVQQDVSKGDYIAHYMAMEQSGFSLHLRTVVDQQLSALAKGDLLRFAASYANSAANLRLAGQTPLDFYASHITPGMSASDVKSIFDAAVVEPLYFQPLPYLDNKTYFQTYGAAYDEYAGPRR